MTLTKIMISLVALLHIYFLVLEMFLWTKPLGRKIFAMSEEKAKLTAVLAANQGLYNGFLAAGLIWALAHPDALVATQIAIFFLACVLTAGAYGAMTVNKRIFLIQGVPALLALGALLIGA
ncbi:MAG: DUF1304 domain-containing protein [Bdellovibrionales bacterium]|nr:DUF1304 domain-containing protein [Bdellovibrionales bacterium]